MHEMALTESIVELIEEKAASRASRACASCGWRSARWRSVEPEAMRFCFDAVARGTIVEGARSTSYGFRAKAGVSIARRPCRSSNVSAPVPNAGGIMCR